MTTSRRVSWKITGIFLLGVIACPLLPAQAPKPVSEAPKPAAEAAPKPAAEIAPPEITTYMGRKIAQTMHWSGAGWLIRHKREQEEGATLMREKLELKPGMDVCDMGSGNGYHALPMARAISPGGKVYCVEIQQEMLDMLQKRALADGVTNLVSVLGSPWDPKLPENSCDLILMVDVYHEFSYPEQMLAGMRKALKPGGRLVQLEFRSEDELVPIKTEHKMSKAQVNKELIANGFKLVKEFDGLPWQHMMWFERDDAAGAAAKP